MKAMTMHNTLKVLGAAAALTLAGMSNAVAAQGQPQVVTQFDDATIARLLLDVQASWQVEAGTNGRSIYRASADGGIAFTVMPRACDERLTCRSLMVLTPFTRSDKRSLAQLDAFISAFNDQTPSGKAYRMQDGTVVLQSYLNAAGGISFANARAQMLVYGQNLVKLREGLAAFAAG
ncbi:MAG: YbjN domain-containing protein [Marinomonas sp.]